MSRVTVLSTLAGVVLTLALGAGALALDRTVLHWYAETSTEPTTPDVLTEAAAPTPTRSPPTEPPAPTKLPDRNDCDAVRGTDYRSPTEREWFLANCLTSEPVRALPAAPQQVDAVPPPPALQPPPPLVQQPPPPPPPLPPPPPVSAAVIETCIDGTFEGWSGDTVFVLCNGQIWQQSSYAYTYHYAYRPDVLIYRTGTGYRMQVEGVGTTIAVVRLQ